MAIPSRQQTKFANRVRKYLLIDEEVNFPPYTVDVLATELWIALEWDGPTHKLSKKKDQIRNEFLLEKYGLPTERFTSLENFDDRIKAIMEKWVEDVDERIERYYNAMGNR